MFLYYSAIHGVIYYSFLVCYCIVLQYMEVLYYSLLCVSVLFFNTWWYYIIHCCVFSILLLDVRVQPCWDQSTPSTPPSRRIRRTSTNDRVSHGVWYSVIYRRGTVSNRTINNQYSETSLIRHSMGPENNVGFGGCWIMECLLPYLCMVTVPHIMVG